jgi:hypothetical protein
MKSQRGEVATILIIGLVVVANVLLAAKVVPIFNGDSRRAKEGQATTAALNQAHEAPAAANTASAQVIGQAAARLPDSPAASFIRNEVPIMLARGPVPDAAELIAAEKRLNAYLSGQLDEARRLHSSALTQAGDLRAALADAQAAKRNADDAISTAAAEALAANRAALGLGVLAALAIAAFVWVKLQAGGLTSALSKLVPIIDAHGTDNLYDTLSKRFDATEKRLIHQLRAKLTK